VIYFFSERDELFASLVQKQDNAIKVKVAYSKEFNCPNTPK
jgi:hypothetical protein